MKFLFISTGNALHRHPGKFSLRRKAKENLSGTQFGISQKKEIKLGPG
jgi:hypothetical protein